MSNDSNQQIPDLSDFSARVQLNLQTMLCLLNDSPKIFILIIPLAFRPPNGRGRPFSWVLLFRLSCLLDTIAKISNCNLFQMIIRLITEGSEWLGYNLIIKSKGKGLRFISINYLIANNFQLTPLILNYSLFSL